MAFFGTLEDFTFFRKKTYNMSFDMNEFIWITSEVWLHSDLIKMPSKLTNLITITPRRNSAVARFYSHLRMSSDINLSCLETGYGLGGDEEQCSIKHSKMITHVFDAVYAVTQALHDMLDCTPGVSCKLNMEMNLKR